MTKKKNLEFQADRIEAVLHVHKVPARVTGGTVTPRWVRFRVIPAVGAKISQLKGLHAEIAAALDVADCRITRKGAMVSVEVPRDDPTPVRFLPLYRQMVETPGQIGWPSYTVLLGLSEDGVPLMMRIPSPDVAHVLIAGTTGSGKTVLLQGMTASLAMRNPPPWPGEVDPLALVLIDPKGEAFAPFRGLPHLARPVITTIEEAQEAIRSLARLMDRRCAQVSRLLEQERFPQTQTIHALRRPLVMLMIDELVDIVMQADSTTLKQLTRLLQRGRDAGIHVIAATQKPISAVLGPLVKANFPVRIVGRVTSIEDGRTASGWSGTGAERLLGRGDFILVAGRLYRFQACMVTYEELVRIVDEMLRKGKQWYKHVQPIVRGEGRQPSIFARLLAMARGMQPPAAPAPGPDIVDFTTQVDTEPPAPLEEEPTSLAPDLLPQAPPPGEEPDEVSVVAARLRTMGFHPDDSYRAACRQLGEPEGGRRFMLVKAAVDLLRQETLEEAEEMGEPDEDELIFAAMSPPVPDHVIPIADDDGDASATASTEKEPEPLTEGDEPVSLVDSDSTVAAADEEQVPPPALPPPLEEPLEEPRRLWSEGPAPVRHGLTRETLADIRGMLVHACRIASGLASRTAVVLQLSEEKEEWPCHPDDRVDYEAEARYLMDVAGDLDDIQRSVELGWTILASQRFAEVLDFIVVGMGEEEKDEGGTAVAGSQP
jgi:S-DNA-T family DNA segregation ATPase FtsK/SpoIIIE